MERSRTGLVADIGRQSVRFALSDGAGDIAPREVRSFLASEHSTFTAALMAYLDGVGLRNIAIPAILAVAGMARGDVINLTGSRWFISLSGVEAVLGTRPRALNECAASALALPSLPASAFTPLDKHAVRPVAAGGSYLIVNIGTGLGVAGLVAGPDGRLVPVQSEGGHMAFAPGSANEERFAARIKAGGRIASAETLLSAAGLVAAYAALAEGGKTVASPEDVTKSIRHDEVAARVVQMFIGYLGAFVGDLVLAFGAWDGVYLGGAIPRALQVGLSDPVFRQRLTAKGAFHRQLSEVPVAIVGRSDLVLLGAAAALAGS